MASDQSVPAAAPASTPGSKMMKIWGLRWIVTGRNKYGEEVKPYRRVYEHFGENMKHMVADVLINDRGIIFVLGAFFFLGIIFYAYASGPAFFLLIGFGIIEGPVVYIILRRLMHRRPIGILEVGFEDQSTLVGMEIPDSGIEETLQFSIGEFTRINMWWAPDYVIGGKPSKGGVQIVHGIKMTDDDGAPMIVVNEISEDRKVAIGGMDAMASGLVIAQVLGEKIDYVHRDFSQYLKWMRQNPREMQNKGLTPDQLVQVDILWQKINDLWNEMRIFNDQIVDILGTSALEAEALDNFDAKTRQFLVGFTKPHESWMDRYKRYSDNMGIALPLFLRLQRNYQIMSAKRGIFDMFAEELRATSTVDEFRIDQKVNHWGIQTTTDYLAEREARRKVLPFRAVTDDDTALDTLYDRYEVEDGFRKRVRDSNGEWQKEQM